MCAGMAEAPSSPSICHLFLCLLRWYLPTRQHLLSSLSCRFSQRQATLQAYQVPLPKLQRDPSDPASPRRLKRGPRPKSRREEGLRPGRVLARTTSSEILREVSEGGGNQHHKLATNDFIGRQPSAISII